MNILGGKISHRLCCGGQHGFQWYDTVWQVYFVRENFRKFHSFRVIRFVMVLLQKSTRNRYQSSVLSCDLVTNFQHTDSELPKLDTVYQEIFAVKKFS